MLGWKVDWVRKSMDLIAHVILDTLYLTRYTTLDLRFVFPGHVDTLYLTRYTTLDLRFVFPGHVDTLYLTRYTTLDLRFVFPGHVDTLYLTRYTTLDLRFVFPGHVDTLYKPTQIVRTNMGYHALVSKYSDIIGQYNTYEFL